jgi:general secretion pathway protein J
MANVSGFQASGNRESGFTLIELLVSLTILTVILGLLSAALHTISKNWTANANGIEKLDTLSRAYDIFKRDISGIRRLIRVTDESRRFVFTGTASRLSFVTTEPPYPTAAGLYFVDYSSVPNGPRMELVRARAPYQSKMFEFPGATPANEVSLLDGPFKYQFSYADKRTRPGQWLASWKKQNQMPDLIRLEVIDARSGAVVAQPFVVALRTDAELGCVVESSDGCSARSNGQFHQNAPTAQDQIGR